MISHGTILQIYCMNRFKNNCNKVCIFFKIKETVFN